MASPLQPLSDGARQPRLEGDARNAVLPPWGARFRLIRANQDAGLSIGRSHAFCPSHCLHQTRHARMAPNPFCVGRRRGRRMSCYSNLTSFTWMTIMAQPGSCKASHWTAASQTERSEVRSRGAMRSSSLATLSFPFEKRIPTRRPFSAAVSDWIYI